MQVTIYLNAGASRAKESFGGKCAFTGGFIVILGCVQAARTREVGKEGNIPIRDVTFLCSQTNRYFCKEITYPVVDLFFTATADQAGEVGSPVEMDSVLWLDPVTVNPEDLAFSSMRATWAVFMRGRAWARELLRGERGKCRWIMDN